MLQLLLAGIAVYLFTGSSKKTPDDYVYIPPTGGTTATNTNVPSGAVLPTLTIHKAASVAKTLKDEMLSWFTSEAEIVKALKGLNEADFQMVYDQFGDEKPADNNWPWAPAYDLIWWINDQVKDEDNIAKLRKQFPHFL